MTCSKESMTDLESIVNVALYRKQRTSECPIVQNSRSEEKWGGSFFTTVYERAARPAGTPALSHTGIYMSTIYVG